LAQVERAQCAGLRLTRCVERAGVPERQPVSSVRMPSDDGFARGHALHCAVPAERWCVTKEDFGSFVATVRDMHGRGDIANDSHPLTGKTNPYHDDPMIGPNIHAVNRYLITPVTRKAGGMSWALMLHESGLPIDFFVTHSWQEGIYEFHSKVMESWPPGATNLWCCFLANPQPWPASELKQLLGSAPDLSDSPFALALSAKTCQMLLAVPNVTESIYARLWCVEEARRAIERNTPVWLATDCGILHWPSGCRSVQEATRAMTSMRLQRSRVWGPEDCDASEASERQLAGEFKTVRSAVCSDANDEHRIRASIRGKEEHIDAMILGLATRGMWLPQRSGTAEALPQPVRDAAAAGRGKAIAAAACAGVTVSGGEPPQQRRRRGYDMTDLRLPKSVSSGSYLPHGASTGSQASTHLPRALSDQNPAVVALLCCPFRVICLFEGVAW